VLAALSVSFGTPRQPLTRAAVFGGLQVPWKRLRRNSETPRPRPVSPAAYQLAYHLAASSPPRSALQICDFPFTTTHCR
jgi:hypothetical protein